MSEHLVAQEAGSKVSGAISPISALIAIIMIVALYTTIKGLYSLTGAYIYAIPFGFVAQSILLIVALNLGRDVARRVTGRSDELKITRAARAVRTVFLMSVYVLFFGICWFFAFSTYYNRFLARGDDVQTTASQAVQLGDVVLPTLRQRIDDRITAAASDLRKGDIVTSFERQVNSVIEAAARPETSKTIAEAANNAAKAAFDARQDQRGQWRTEETKLGGKLNNLLKDIKSRESELADLKSEQAKLPDRIRDLRRAIKEEQPPEPASGTPPPSLIQQPARSGQLKPDGLASTLVPQAAACRLTRNTGRGDCLAALESALRQGEARLSALPQEITNKESALEILRTEADALPKRLAQLADLLKNNPPLPAPLPTSAAKSGPDLGPLAKAKQAFAEEPTEQTFVALSDACRPIESALRVLKPVPEVLNRFDCTPAPVLAAVTAQDRLVGARLSYLESCGQKVVTGRTTTIVNQMRDDFTHQTALRGDDAARRERLGRAIDEVRRDIIDPCLTLAPQFGVTVDDLNRQARAFEDRISPRQTEFSLAANAVVQVLSVQATPPGYLGALFAAAQELAILLLSILRDINRGSRASTPRRPAVAPAGGIVNWGPEIGDPPAIAAAKIILQSPGGRLDGSIYLPPTFGAEQEPEIQANIHQILRELKREGSARRPLFRRGMRLNSDGVEKLEHRITEYTAGREAQKTKVDQRDGSAEIPSASTPTSQKTPERDAETIAAGTIDDSRADSSKNVGQMSTGRRPIGVRG